MHPSISSMSQTEHILLLLLLLLLMVMMMATALEKNQSPKSRLRRGSGRAEILNAEEQKIVVDAHNELRRQEKAANMALLVITQICY